MEWRCQDSTGRLRAHRLGIRYVGAEIDSWHGLVTQQDLYMSILQQPPVGVLVHVYETLEHTLRASFLAVHKRSWE